MDDLTDKVIAELDRTPGPWEVLAGEFTPRPKAPVCGEYPTARAAHDALLEAGYEVTAAFFPMPPLAALYDQRTAIRYRRGDLFVLLIQRMPGS
jgi:hypothetical protein